jgi:FMN phosphatase YigB (HAD superfamily)
MIKAVLLDLDDTLLRTNTDQFVAQYIAQVCHLLLEHDPSLATAEIPIDKAITRATRALIGNLDPTLTNAEVFAHAMYDMLGLSISELRPLFEGYYRGTYGELAAGVAVVPAAAVLVKRLVDMGLIVVIATNPLFALEPIMLRLKWAGLDQPTIPYALVTHLDNMHFAKPHPQYYEEILARIGVEADEALMVGDSVQNDIVPAANTGMNTFWIDLGIPAEFPDSIVPDGTGSLEEFDDRVAEGWLSTLTPHPRTPAQVGPRMLGDTAALFSMVREMNPAYWHLRPDPNEWSPLEIVCHLRDSERNVQRPRLQRIANEDNPFISRPPAPPGPGERDFTDEDGYAALGDFWSERCATLKFLATLRDDDWMRPARHSIFGPTTLLEMAHFTTRHDHLHLNQLRETVERCV